MGYYTYHELSIISGDKNEIDKFWGELYENDSYMYEDIKRAVGDDGNGGDSCKWYEHESDMKRISKEFPSVVFELSGEGEESGDIWKEYYKNGRMQRCNARIEFDPYDENQLH